MKKNAFAIKLSTTLISFGNIYYGDIY